MNFYCVVEGKSEKRIFPKWINYCNKNLKFVKRIEDVNDNCVLLISGNGYPNFFEIIENAIKDINNSKKFDKLIISVDSELLTYEEKEEELIDFLKYFSLEIEVVLIIQFFCLETWALGHRRIYRRRTTNPILKEYIKYFDVCQKDPELLPDYLPEEINRVEFAYKYLHLGINDIHTRLTYSKSNPSFIGEEHFFNELVARYSDTNHIKSFNKFLETFRS